MNEITQCAMTSWPRAKLSQKGRSAKSSDYDSLTCFSQHAEQVAEMTKRCTPSQTDVIFVVMDALVRIYEDDLIAKRNVNAIPWPYALGSSLLNLSPL